MSQIEEKNLEGDSRKNINNISLKLKANKYQMRKLQKLINYLLYLFVFLLPWQTRWMWYEGKLNNGFWEYGTYSLYGIDIIFGLILVLFLFWRLKRNQSTINNRLSTSDKGLLLTVSCLLLIAFLSIFWAQDRSLALYASVKFLEGILLFWVVRTIKPTFAKLGIAFVSSAVIQAGLGIWQFITQSTFTNKWLGLALQESGTGGVSVIENVTGRWLRAYGSLPHPNILAGWLVIGLFVLLSLAYRLAVQKRSFWKVLSYNFWINIFVYWSFVIIAAGLFFTFSREAGFALITGLIFFGIIISIKKQAAIFYKLLVAGLAMIIILSVIFWPLLSTRLLGQDRLEMKSIQQRAAYLRQSFQLIKKYPFLGVGIGNYTLAVHNQINPNLKSWDYQPVHNIYLLVLTELGMIGFIIFLWLIWLISRKLPISDNQSIRPLICFSILFVVLIIGFFDHYFWTLHFGIMLFWLILGLTFRNFQK